MSSLIEKYKIAELDVYKLALIESKKVGSSYMQKERLKAAALIVLKPYKVSFLDLAKITNEIKAGGFNNNIELQKKYSNINLEEQISNDSNIGKYYSGVIDTFKSYSRGKKAAIIIGTLLVLSFFMQNNNSSSSSSSSSTYSNSTVCSKCGKLLKTSAYYHYAGNVGVKNVSDCNGLCYCYDCASKYAEQYRRGY